MMDFSTTLLHSMSESQTRFAVTSDNVRELDVSFNKNKTEPRSAVKLGRHHSSITPATAKPRDDKVM